MTKLEGINILGRDLQIQAIKLMEEIIHHVIPQAEDNIKIRGTMIAVYRDIQIIGLGNLTVILPVTDIKTKEGIDIIEIMIRGLVITIDVVTRALLKIHLF